jgi:hypothetical protein
VSGTSVTIPKASAASVAHSILEWGDVYSANPEALEARVTAMNAALD